MITVLRISLFLSEEGFRWYEKEWEGEETKVSYVISHEGDKRRISKSKMMVPDNKTYDTHKSIGYAIWCFPSQREEAKKIVEEKVIKVATQIREEALKMFAHLNKNSKVPIQTLYYNYKKVDDERIIEYLKKILLVIRKHFTVPKGTALLWPLKKESETNWYGYYPLSNEAMEKINKKPRNISLTFDATEHKEEPVNLESYKRITFLIKSSSRFFLKPDIGEVFDQIEYDDLWDSKLKGICVNLNDYSLLPGTEGEHFLMTADLLKESTPNVS